MLKDQQAPQVQRVLKDLKVLPAQPVLRAHKVGRVTKAQQEYKVLKGPQVQQV